MNSAVRAVVRMGIYVGCKVFLIKEVCVFNITVLFRIILNTSIETNVSAICLQGQFFTVSSYMSSGSVHHR